ncbi:MAG: DUF4058 family protein [Cyanobacteria bacterium P01_F01_bin.86]
MASPFPGMDPYLEQSAFWSPFHNRLMVGFANRIAPALRPQYYVEVETRSYMDMPEGELLVGIPDAVILRDSQNSAESDKAVSSTGSSVAVRTPPQTVTLPVPVEVRERYLEVREIGSNQVVTAIELLSPANKKKGKGRDVYEAKRAAILSSQSHFIEIDLLRGQAPFPVIGASSLGDYYVLVSRADDRPKAQFYSFTLREKLPEFLLPLKDPDEAIAVDLQSIFQEVCEQASYDLRIDYTQPVPAPALSSETQAWADDLIKSHGN